MISRADVEAAWGLIRPHVRRTPAIELPAGSLGVRAPVALKLESLQVSGSFKGRGAFHKLLASKVPAAGIIAASGGNHGAAAAYAARALGYKAEIFVPTIASPTKVARLRSYGAVVHQVGAVYAEARAAAEKRAAETGALTVPAYEDEVVFAGAAAWRSSRRAGRVRHLAGGRGRRGSLPAARQRSAKARGSWPSRPRERPRCTKRCVPAIRSRSRFPASPPMRWAPA
jgi:threonine dehydratase